MSTHTKNQKIIGAVVCAIIIFGIGFVGGDKYDQAQATKARANRQNSSGQFSGRGGRGMGGFVSGAIISKDATSITVQLSTGGSKIVFLSNSSTISKSVAGTTDDLSMGENVMVTGTPNSDGSVTATSVQIRPAMPTTTTAPAGVK